MIRIKDFLKGVKFSQSSCISTIYPWVTPDLWKTTYLKLNYFGHL